jgi:hypothetical protein
MKTAVEMRFFTKPLLSNGCFIFSFLVVVAQQRVYKPQYVTGLSIVSGYVISGDALLFDVLDLIFTAPTAYVGLDFH